MNGKIRDDKGYAIANTLKYTDMDCNVDYIKIKANIVKMSDGTEVFENIQVTRFLI
jgi:hypothetical protein